MQPVKILPLSVETYATIDREVKEYILNFLNLDSYYLTDDIRFQRDVERYYTKLKFDAFRDNVFFMTRVVDYKLTRIIDPNTNRAKTILPPDFVNYWPGYDKNIVKAPYIYNTSRLKGDNAIFISYRRYIRDNDTLVAIPGQFKEYIALKTALRLNLNNRFQTTNFDKRTLEVELGIQKQKALSMDVALFNTL